MRVTPESGFHPYVGCPMSKRLCKLILSKTSTRATKELGQVFVDLSYIKSVQTLGGKQYTMIVREHYSRYTFRRFLADVVTEGEV